MIGASIRGLRRAWRLPYAAVALAGLGCASVQPVREPVRFIERAGPQATVYLTFKNQSKVTLTRLRVSGDSLVGSVAGVTHPVAAPLSHIERIDAMQRDATRTRWLVAGLTVVTVAGIFALTQSGSDTWSHPCNRASTDECDYGEYRFGS